MTRDDQLALFARDLNALLERYAQEFDLKGVEVVGVLHCATIRIANNITPGTFPRKDGQPPENPA